MATEGRVWGQGQRFRPWQPRVGFSNSAAANSGSGPFRDGGGNGQRGVATGGQVFPDLRQQQAQAIGLGNVAVTTCGMRLGLIYSLSHRG
jgi:hypothetical protein